MKMVKASDAKIERAVLLMEECSEVQKCVGKLLRFGEESEFLNRPGEGFEVEIADILYAIKLMDINGDIDMNKVREHYNTKTETCRLLQEHKLPKKTKLKKK